MQETDKGLREMSKTMKFGGRIAAAVGVPLIAAITTLGLAAPHADAATVTPAAKGKVVAKIGLSSRSAPSTHAPKAGSGYAKGQEINIDCKLTGTNVNGNKIWYKVHGHQRWVSARYVENIGAAPRECYLHMGTYARTTAPLSIRQAPSTADAKTGSLKKGAKVVAWCKVKSQSVKGDRTWYYGAKVTDDGFTKFGWLSDKYLKADDPVSGDAIGYKCNVPTPK